MLLNRHPDAPETPAALAHQLGVQRATVTGLLDTLEKDALIERSQAPNDRRLTHVQLTAKGAALMDLVLPQYFRHVSSLLSPLSPEEHTQFVQLLQKIQEGLGENTPQKPDSGC
jgi:DNA-binding MarR family transcriptional regulator